MSEQTLTVRQPCPPFCWQNKIVLSFIREHTAESVLPSRLLVYFVLTELASDEHAEGAFRAKHAEIERKAGLSRRSIVTHLQGLETCGVLSVFPNFGADGRQLPSIIRLHGPEELPKAGGEGATIARGEGAIARGGVCTPFLIRKGKKESPHTPQGGAASPSACPGIDEVRAYAAETGASPETAERFQRMNTASGWRDNRGRPIRNWQRAFLAFAKCDQTRAAKIGGADASGPASRKEKAKTFFRADHAKGF